MRYFIPVLLCALVLGGCDTITGGNSGGECKMGPLETNDDDTTEVLSVTAPSQYSYGGAGKEADWREAAQARIEKHRKATLDVTVVDGDGNPVENADVFVKMQQHEFNFGTAVSDRLIGNRDNRYLNTLENTFNYATIETGLKYYNWDNGEDRRERVRNTVNWLNDNDFAVRGHAAFWEEYWWMNIDENQSAEAIHQEMKNKIRGRLSEFEGQMRDWDAQNHPFHRPGIRRDIASETNMTEQEVAAEWWAVANEADQQALMGINEQNLIQRYPCCDFRGRYDSWIQDLTNMGVDIEAIGFMGHANITRLEDMSYVKSVLDRFSTYDVPLYVSEFHITLDNWGNKSWDEASQAEKDAQAAYLRDFLTMFFSHPAAETFVHWTFWEGQAWRQTSALFAPDWSVRDHGEMFKKLVKDRWWTDVQGRTDANGVYSVEAFKGTHRVVVEHCIGETSTTVDLSEDDAIEITIQ